jgi:hypothetical protein
MAKTEKTYVARDPVALSATVVLWLYLLIAAQVASLVCEIYRYSALRQLPPDTPLNFFETPPALESMETITGLVAIPMLAVMLVSFILTLKWIYRVTMNSHVLAQGVRVSPPWAVGWYFVPIANFFKPFQAVADAWKVSLGPQDWRERETPALLRWWWGTWLFVSILDNASMRMDLRADDVGDARGIAAMDGVSAILWIPLTLLLIRIVRRLSAQQSTTLGVATFS